MDAMIAAMTALAMASVIAGMISESSATNFNQQQIASTGNDMLAVMQANETFNNYIGKPVDTVNASLRLQLNILPLSYCGNITLKIYDAYSFQLKTTYFANTSCMPGKSVTNIRRTFASYDSQQFGIAELTLGLAG